MHLFRNKKGQGLIEYLIIVAIVAVGALGIMKVVGQNVKANFANVALALQGKERTARRDTVEESQYKKRDMSDFFEGAANNDSK